MLGTSKFHSCICFRNIDLIIVPQNLERSQSGLFGRDGEQSLLVRVEETRAQHKSYQFVRGRETGSNIECVRVGC